MTKQLSPTTHVSPCEYNSTLCLLLATDAWATITGRVGRGFINLCFSTLGWLSPFNCPDHQVSVWFCLILLPFLSRAALFLLLALGFSSFNKISSLLFSVFTSCASTITYKSSLHLELIYLLSLCCFSFGSAFLLLSKSGLSNKGSNHIWCWWSPQWQDSRLHRSI